MEGADRFDQGGDAIGAAPQLPREPPCLQGRHDLLTDGSDTGMRDVDGPLTGGEVRPTAALRDFYRECGHSDVVDLETG